MSYLENLRLFTRIYELGNLSTAGHDLRLTPAVASSRLRKLEQHLGVRLFNRTTRKLTPTAQGDALYAGVVKVFDALTEAEASVSTIGSAPRGSIRVTAPLGIGRSMIAPALPEFRRRYPEISVRLRLSDHVVDLLTEGVDAGVFLGVLKDSGFRVRRILECPRVLCAAPSYIERRGAPRTPRDLIAGGHDCLLLRYTGSPEYVWTLSTPEGPVRVEPSGPFDTDFGEILTDWALAGHGILNRERFQVAEHLAAGRLIEVLPETPPVPAALAILYPHKRLMDPKLRVFIDFMAEHCRAAVEEIGRRFPAPTASQGAIA